MILISELSHQSDLGQQSVSLCEDDSILDDTMSVSLFQASLSTDSQKKSCFQLPNPPDSEGSVTGSSTAESSQGNNAISDSGSSAPSIESQSVASNSDDCDWGSNNNDMDDANFCNDDDNNQGSEIASNQGGPAQSTSAENANFNERQTRNKNNRLSKMQQEPEPKAPLADPWEPITPHEAANTIPKPIRRGRIRRAPTRNVQLAGTKSRPKKQPPAIDERQVIVPVEDFMIQQLSGGKYSLNGLRVGNKETGMAAELQDRADNVEKEKKRKAALENKQNNNVPQGGEIENILHLEDNEEGDNDDIDEGWTDANFVENEDEFENEPLPDPHEGGVAALVPADLVNSGALGENRTIGDNVEPATEEGVDSYEELVMKRVAAYVAQSQDYIESTDLAKRVAKWHDSIGPRLDAVERRGNFDIHQYGSKILGYFPEGKAKTTISFAELSRGKEREEVARYFLSSLMLANTYNIEIRNSIEKPLVMDQVEMTLLSTKRHHENMFQEMEVGGQAKNTTSPKRKGRQRKSSAANGSLISDEEHVRSPSSSSEKTSNKKAESPKVFKTKRKSKSKTIQINGLLHPITEEPGTQCSNIEQITNNHTSTSESVHPCSVNLERLDDSQLLEGEETSPATHNSVPIIHEHMTNGVMNELNSPTFKVPLPTAGNIKQGKRRKIMR